MSIARKEEIRCIARLLIKRFSLYQVIGGVDQTEACCDNKEENGFVRVEVVRVLDQATDVVDGKNKAQKYSDTHGGFVCG